MEHVVSRTPGSITFRVDDVEPATARLAEVRTHEALKDLAPESCCDYSDLVIAGATQNGLLEAVHRAFSQHRPLVLSPDMIWLAIAQGFANHVLANSESLRSRLVAHPGRMTLQVRRDDFVEGSPENDWTGIFSDLAAAVREHVTPLAHEVLVPSFSTTGPVERAAFQVTLLDAFQQFFDYEMMCICGIPQVTLEGEVSDWLDIERRAGALRSYDLEWWIDPLMPVLRQLTRTAGGDVDRPHWQRIYKLREAYGDDLINGWFLRLFPYVEAWPTGRPTRRNPALETRGGRLTEDLWWEQPDSDGRPFGGGGEGLTSSSIPRGLSVAPLRVRCGEDDPGHLKELIAGFVGVTQGEDLALRPKIGWAVRRAPALETALYRLERDHRPAPPPSTQELQDLLGHLDSYPGALKQLYSAMDGAAFSGGARLLPLAEVTVHRPGEWDPLIEVAERGEERFGLYHHQGKWIGVSYPGGQWAAWKPAAASLGELLLTLCG